MKQKIAAWLGKARTLESAIEGRVEGKRSGRAAPAGPDALELIEEVIDRVTAEIVPAGRGRYVFPFTHVDVTFAATGRGATRIEVAAGGPPSLDQRVGDRLRNAGCDAPPVTLSVAFAPQAEDAWLQPEFDIVFRRETASEPPAPPPAASTLRRLDLEVAHGVADRTAYSFVSEVVTIGRGLEVRDVRHRLLRTNSVAFLDDGSDVNLSVSRRHASIVPDPNVPGFRLHAEHAAGELCVLRGGRGVAVPRGRGLRLQSGDVVVLGQARIGVRIVDPDESGEA